MRVKFLALFAALFLVSACSTATDDMSASSGSGDAMMSSSDGGPVSMAESKNTQRYLSSIIGDRVFFDFDKYNISAAAAARLEEQAAWLGQYPGVTVTIEGHCDERGTREYNLALGERRANSAKEYLVALGIDGNRIGTISYGKERPAVVGFGEAVWAQNRRGVMVIN